MYAMAMRGLFLLFNPFHSVHKYCVRFRFCSFAFEHSLLNACNSFERQTFIPKCTRVRWFRSIAAAAAGGAALFFYSFYTWDDGVYVSRYSHGISKQNIVRWRSKKRNNVMKKQLVKTGHRSVANRRAKLNVHSAVVIRIVVDVLQISNCNSFRSVAAFCDRLVCLIFCLSLSLSLCTMYIYAFKQNRSLAYNSIASSHNMFNIHSVLKCQRMQQISYFAIESIKRIHVSKPNRTACINKYML